MILLKSNFIKFLKLNILTYFMTRKVRQFRCNQNKTLDLIYCENVGICSFTTT